PAAVRRYCDVVRSFSRRAASAGTGASGRRWRRGAVGPARWAVSAHFLVMGLTGGAWMARVPSAKSQAHLSDGTLGVALFAVPVGLVRGAGGAAGGPGGQYAAVLDLRRRQLRGGRDPGPGAQPARADGGAVRHRRR